jgi:hypothetical protein
MHKGKLQDLDWRLDKNRLANFSNFNREGASQNTLCNTDNFFVAFLLVSRDYASNNALEDNLG